MYTKVIRFDALELWRDFNRAIGKRVVATNGCFDILHRGHVTYLQKAREMGDILIVGVNSDRSVRELKGEGRPINCQEDRAAVVAALEAVDAVVIFDDLSAQRFLTVLRPEFWVKGGDYTDETLDQSEVQAIKFAGGEISIIPFVAGYSTTRSISALDSLPGEETTEGKILLLERDLPQRVETDTADRGGSSDEEPGEDAGSVLRAPESLRERRGVFERDTKRDVPSPS